MSHKSTFDDAVRIFRHILESEWKFTRGPYNLKSTYSATKRAPPDDTGKIFLNENFKAWLAYFIALPGEVHGRKGRRRAINAFDSLPIEDRIRAARIVAQVTPHNSVEAAIRDAYDAITAAKAPELKRRRLSNMDRESTREMSPAPTPSTAEALLNVTSNTQDEQPAELNQLGQIVSTEPQPTTATGPSTTQQQSTEINPFEMITTNPPSNTQVLSHPPLKALANIFPDYMCGAIVRNGALGSMTAGVMLYFPLNPLWSGCIMTLEILSTKVEYIAMALFKVHVETGSSSRHVVLPDGNEISSDSAISLLRCEVDPIPLIFGEEIRDAVKNSPAGLQELDEGPRRTRAITMSIRTNPAEGATIHLSLGLAQSFSIAPKLWELGGEF